MASKSNGLEPHEWARAPAPKGPALERFAKAIYNPEKKTFLGRTTKSWGVVLLFYSIFYAVLACLIAVCFLGLLAVLDDKYPRYTLAQSLIGTNPGVAFRPLPENGYKVVYKQNDSAIYQEDLKNFLQPYESLSWFQAKKGCKADEQYGYPNSPCFIIKLNKIFNWEPEYLDKAPADASDSLKAALGAGGEKQIWVDCFVDDASKTKDVKFEYPWGRGFPAQFYPYTNQPDYQSPLVAVKVQAPMNMDVIFRCRALAGNIIYNKSIKEASGYARVLLHIET